MKKLLLSVSALFFVAYASSQVICKGVSPAAIAGNYTFTWADPAGGWGTPDFLTPNTWVEDTLMLVEETNFVTTATSTMQFDMQRESKSGLRIAKLCRQ